MKRFKLIKLSLFFDHHLSTAATKFNDQAVDETIYASDEFRMYAYKIKRCPRTRSHDWTECPYAHRGEKAQRRDPRKHGYAAVICPAFRNGGCEKGDACEFAHGVFEYWLHPARYRTRACNSGQFCQRKVCFFAHSPEQLRPEIKFKRHYFYRPIRTAAMDAALNGINRKITSTSSTLMNGGDGSSSAATSSSSSSPGLRKSTSAMSAIDDEYSFDKFSEFLKSLRALKISDGGDYDLDHDHRDHHDQIRRDHQRMAVMMSRTNSSWLMDVSESDLPHVEWISELVQ